MVKYSIVVPTFNRAKLLSEVLTSVLNQTISNLEYEIIVVDDGSNDNTKNIVESFIKKDNTKNLLYVFQSNRGPAAARNVGIKNSSGKIIFFIDDDCKAPINWLENILLGYEKYPEVIGVSGWYDFENNSDIWSKYQTCWAKRRFGNVLNFEKIYNTAIGSPCGNTANTSYKKDILTKVGGFDEAFGSPGFEDWDLKKRIHDRGYLMLFLPNNVTHIRSLNIIEIFTRFLNFGKSRYKFVKKYPEYFNFYNPTFYSLVVRQIKKDRSKGWLIKIMIILDFIFTRMGWEYQKFIEGSELR